MGKPLLTDDVIEKANRGELNVDKPAMSDMEETKIIVTDDEITISEKESPFEQLNELEDSPEMVYKSRRIENAKRSEFQHKLNKVLIIVVILVILLFWAAFNL